MGFEVSKRAKEINDRLELFMDEHIYPRERDYDEFTSNQRSSGFTVSRIQGNSRSPMVSAQFLFGPYQILVG